MYTSNLLSLTLFLGAAHLSHARPQDLFPPVLTTEDLPPVTTTDGVLPVPTTANSSCLTTVFIGSENVLVATPGPSGADLEVRTVIFSASSAVTSLVANTTVVQGAPAITPVPGHSVAINNASNIVVDDNQFLYDSAILCPRFAFVSANATTTTFSTSVLPTESVTLDPFTVDPLETAEPEIITGPGLGDDGADDGLIL